MSEWKEYKLGQIGYFNNGVNKGKDSFGHGYPFVNLMDIFDKDIIDQIPKGLVDVSQDELKRYNLIDGDILFVRSSVKLEGVGKVCSITKDLENTIYSGFIIRYRQPELKIDKLFASYYLNSAPIRTKIIAKATLSANSNVNQESLKTIPIKIPLLPEQHQIARILSTADAVIEKTQAAIDKYKAIKQGMLHDLFTRGIDISTGKLRPKYEDAPELYKESKLGMIPKEWEEKRLEEFTTIIGDGIHTTPRYSENTDYHFINGNNLSNGEILIGSALCVNEEEYKRHFKELNSRTILYSINGTIGNIAIYKNQKVILGKSACFISCKSNVNLDYIFFFIQSFPVFKFYELEMTGSTIKNLSLASVRNTPITIPKEDDEQKIIAERIRTINNKLQTEESYLLKLQQIKIGLMGDLLSGKKRVTIKEEEMA